MKETFTFETIEKVQVFNDIIDEYETSFPSENTIELKIRGKKIGKIELKDEKNFTINTSKPQLIERFKSVYDELEKVKNNKYEKDNLLLELPTDNKQHLQKISKQLTDIGIKKVLFKTIFIHMGETFFEDLTLAVCPDISDTLGSSNSNINTNVGKLNEIYGEGSNVNNSSAIILNSVSDDPRVPIKIDNKTYGTYYKERNLLMMFFNPFTIKEIPLIKQELKQPVKDFLNSILTIKPIEVDTTDIKEKLFVEAFTRKAKDKLKENIERVKETEKRINEADKTIRLGMEDITNFNEENKFIERNLDEKGTKLFTELEQIKKLPFINKVSYEGELIELEFIPTNISVNNFRRFSGGREFGKRTMWLGPITYKIKIGRASCRERV